MRSKTIQLLLAIGLVAMLGACNAGNQEAETETPGLNTAPAAEEGIEEREEGEVNRVPATSPIEGEEGEEEEGEEEGEEEEGEEG